MRESYAPFQSCVRAVESLVVAPRDGPGAALVSQD